MHLGRQGLRRRSAIRGSFDSDDVADFLQNPYSLGWAKQVKFDHDFIGRQALERIAENPPRSRVTLEFDDDDVMICTPPCSGTGPPMTSSTCRIHNGGSRGTTQFLTVVVVISANPGYSYYFRRVLTLAYVDTACRDPGTRLNVLWGSPGTPQEKIAAAVAKAPYKQDRRRSDLSGGDLPPPR